MEQINVAGFLKNAPAGLKLYSPVYGEVTFSCVFGNENVIKCFKGNNKINVYFDKYGKIDSNGEVMLFPSKDNRLWDNQTISPFFFDCKFKDCCPKQAKQDNHFEPFDKVLVRNEDNDPWDIELFSYIIPGRKYRYQGIRSCWKHCIPYNDNTKHLVGTTDSYLG